MTSHIVVQRPLCRKEDYHDEQAFQDPPHGERDFMDYPVTHVKVQMPKGALLHVHQYATVEAGFLLDLTLQQPAIHIRCPNVIDKSTIAKTLPEIKPIPREQYTDNCGITDSAYVPNTWVKMRTARETFDPSLGGAEGFDKWIVSTFVINPSEAYGSHNTLSKVRPVYRTLRIVAQTSWYCSDLAEISKHVCDNRREYQPSLRMSSTSTQSSPSSDICPSKRRTSGSSSCHQ